MDKETEFLLEKSHEKFLNELDILKKNYEDMKKKFEEYKLRLEKEES